MDQEQTQKTILVADDDPFITVVYSEGLENAGYRVIVAHDGDEALEKMNNEHPDLVLLDIIMPKQSGFEVLQTVQATPDLSSIPILVLTNLSQASDEKEARRYGAVDFMTKSDVSFNEVLLRVQRWLDANTNAPTPQSQAPSL